MNDMNWLMNQIIKKNTMAANKGSFIGFVQFVAKYYFNLSQF